MAVYGTPSRPVGPAGMRGLPAEPIERSVSGIHLRPCAVRLESDDEPFGRCLRTPLTLEARKAP